MGMSSKKRKGVRGEKERLRETRGHESPRGQQVHDRKCRDDENAHKKRKRERKNTQLVMMMPSSSEEAVYIHRGLYYEIR